MLCLHFESQWPWVSQANQAQKADLILLQLIQISFIQKRVSWLQKHQAIQRNAIITRSKLSPTLTRDIP